MSICQSCVTVTEGDKNIYQPYISNEGIIFVRHYGTYEGSEGFAGLLSALESTPSILKINGVLLDTRAVIDISLEDTDRANASFFMKKLLSCGQMTTSVTPVLIYDSENVRVNKILLERDQRVTDPIADLLTSQRVSNQADALKILGLPADYLIEHPSEEDNDK